MPAAISKEKMASIILEALYSSDERACQRYGICTRTLIRYRQSMSDDPELSAIVQRKKAVLDAAWAEDFPVVLRKGGKLLAECWEEIQKDPDKKKDPQVIAAIAGAMKLTAEIQLTGRVIDARLAHADRSAGELPVTTSDNRAETYTN